MEKNATLNKLLGKIFPIYRHELRKFIPLTVVFFLLSTTYAILRGMKSLLLMQHTTIEAMYCLRLISIAPIVLLTIIYSTVSKVTSRDGRFKVVVGYFVACFVVVYFLFIPHLEALKLNQLAADLTARAPHLQHLWEVLRVWPLSLLYIHVDGWTMIVWGIVFWTFINEVTDLKQSKRFYVLLGLGAEVGLILTGVLFKYAQLSPRTLLGLVLIMMFCILAVYNLLARDFTRTPALYQVTPRPARKRVTLSMMASARFLMRSAYLAHIATLVVLCRITFTLFESVWNAQVKVLAENSSDLTRVLSTVYGSYDIYNGVLSMVLTLFLAAPIMKRSWRFAASLTPIATLLATIVFFGLLYCQDTLRSLALYWHIDPILLTVVIGMLNMVSIKSVGYALFNPTKEQVYIPLDEELKVRGKAAVDGIGSRLGKSLGSFMITIIIVPLCGSIHNARPLIFVAMLCMLFLWLRTISKLDALFKALSEQKADQTVDGEDTSAG